MTTRIAVIGTGFRPTGGTEPPAEIAVLVGEGIRAELVEIPDGIFPGDPKSRELVDQQYLAAGLNVAANGFDAIYINTVGDYGLRELRAAVDIPVLGSGEAACQVAAGFGPFSIVTIWPPSLAFLYHRVLARSNTEPDCLGITHLSKDPDMASLADEHNFVTDMRACHFSTMEQIRQARDAAVEDAGAKAVVLGCTCMAPVAKHLAVHPEAFTLDAMTLGYRATEYCLRQQLNPQSLTPSSWRAAANM